MVDEIETKFKDESDIKCDICEQTFLSLEVLDIHNAEKHEDASGAIWCHHCNIKKKSFNALKAHIDSKHPEHGEKKHFCKKCDEGFIFESSLKAHKMKHKQKQKESKERKKTMAEKDKKKMEKLTRPYGRLEAR